MSEIVNKVIIRTDVSNLSSNSGCLSEFVCKKNVRACFLKFMCFKFMCFKFMCFRFTLIFI